MRINKKITLPLLAAGALAGMTSAQAAVVSVDTFNNIVENFQSFNGLVTQGPQALSNGLSVTSTINSTIGAFQVDLADNGNWGAGNRFAGIGDLSFGSTATDFNGSMTFNLGGAHFGGGATFSIYQPTDGARARITLDALDIFGAVLESTSFSFNSGDPFASNVGTFRGFQRNAGDLYGLRVSGDGFVLDNVSVAPVPLPAGLPLLLSGLAGVFGMLRRRPLATA